MKIKCGECGWKGTLREANDVEGDTGLHRTSHWGCPKCGYKLAEREKNGILITAEIVEE